MQSTEQKFTDLLNGLAKLWAQVVEPNSEYKFIEVRPHALGEKHNPKVVFKVDDQRRTEAVEWLIQEICERIDTERERSGRPVTRKL